MGFKENMKEWGGASLTFLSEDGERVVFMVVADPVLIEGKYGRTATKRIGIPCVTEEGFSLLTVGMRVGRRLAKHTEAFDTRVFEIVRHGEQGDTNTRYVLTVLEDPDVYDTLAPLASVPVDPEELAESIDEATKLANS